MEVFFKCKECDSGSFYGGPKGGLAQNILCCGCGIEYTYSPSIVLEMGRDATRAQAVYGIDINKLNTYPSFPKFLSENKRENPSSKAIKIINKNSFIYKIKDIFDKIIFIK